MKKLDARPNLPKMEESVQEFWNETKAFEHSVEMRPKDKPYVFYDGPPFATGMPHYGHLLVSTIKDAVPRYWTMKGYRVERVWGWDCHGLPIENMIEQKLKIKGGKKGIEELGIPEFNNACRSEVLRLDKEWEKIINRLGRWVDFKNNYKTMDTTFMESVWWGFQQLFNKGLVYQGRKVVMYCPRCATPLSNFEIAMDNSYKDVEDNSVYVKFKRKDATNEYFVAWTTTPWTLPGNVGLAVQSQAEYSLVQIGDEKLWMAHSLVDHLVRMQEIEKAEIIKTVKGSELDGMEYEPLYDYMPTENKKAHYIMTADFVSLEDGTGIVHTAAIYGEDDYALAQKKNLPCVPTLDDEGKFKSFVTPLAGIFYKKSEQWVIDDLKNRGLLYHSNKYTHSYPFCYRCSTPLYYNAVPAWFIDVQQLKDSLINHNEAINWFPDHLKHGRFGKGLETAPDWNVSRSRYWGTPMPIWEATEKKVESGMIESRESNIPHSTTHIPRRRVIGSIEELKQWAVHPELVEGLTDIHREFIDDIEVWIDDEKTIKGKRIPEVFDCWVESGSMPFASKHYPFENKEAFEAAYPAQFVTEYIAQTRAWFYTMHVMSVGIFDKHSFENVLTTGNILGKDGSKMSKSKNNYPDPMLLINEYGVDSLRLYLMSSPVMKAENLNFDENEVSDIRKRIFIIWYNMVAFYMLYAPESGTIEGGKWKIKPENNESPHSTLNTPHSENVMDKWLLSKLNTLIKNVTEYMDGYNLAKASRELMSFIDELSTWYLRRSRDRIRDGEGQSREIFGYVLVTVAQLFAPITPFFSEWVYHTLVDEKNSIHHTDWPEFDEALIDTELEEKMTAVRGVVEKVHAARSEAGMRIRQPLAKVTVSATTEEPYENLLDVLKDEVNVKEVAWQQQIGDLEAVLDTNLTPELIAEGEARELIRNIQKLRKTAEVDLNAVLTVTAPTWPTDWQDEIERKTKTKLTKGDTLTIV